MSTENELTEAVTTVNVGLIGLWRLADTLEVSPVETRILRRLIEGVQGDMERLAKLAQEVAQANANVALTHNQRANANVGLTHNQRVAHVWSLLASEKLAQPQQEKRIQFIKAIREVTNWGLREAKDAADAIYKEYPPRQIISYGWQ